MIKIDVLKIIHDKGSRICDDCIASNQNFTRIQVNKRCTQLERDSFISREKQTCSNCRKLKISNAITANGTDYLIQLANKGQVSELTETETSGQFFLNIKFEWVPLDVDGIRYQFPASINRTKKSTLHKPAVYRWILINQHGKRTQNIYIGEATELAQRIYNYVNPGNDQQTNIRLNKLFHELNARGHKIEIDQLRFEPFKIGNHLVENDSLKNKYVRRLLEQMMTSYYYFEGYNVINA
jgi:hypothetical protein